MQLNTDYYHSPVGNLKCVANDTHLLSIQFVETLAEIGSNSNDLLNDCRQQLDEYFQGTRKIFDLPLDQKGTAFQTNVWKQLQEIPYGKTLSYLNFSKQIGDIKAIRAIASSNGRNNLAIVVPCHRVIGSDAKLVGYAGGLWRKKWLLEHERKYFHGIEQSTLF